MEIVRLQNTKLIHKSQLVFFHILAIKILNLKLKPQ